MFRTLIMALLLSMFAGCATVEMRRSKLEQTCDLTEIGTPIDAAKCAQAPREIGPKFQIAYVEFTDQGWLYDRRQLEQALALLKDEPDRNLQVVLFVHGWKHSAEVHDQNVELFRATIMKQFAEHDQKARTVGIYVGWRGASLEVADWIQNLTFYDRKSTAELVARGSVRELLAHMRAIKRQRADRFSATAIGHSFGGLILFNSLASSLLDSIVEANNGELAKPREVKPVFDLVLLLNPAFEASRFEPLFQAARRKPREDGSDWHYSDSQQPVFVSITSEADWATRIAFPLGRAVTSLLQHEGRTDQDDLEADYADRLEKRANTHTIGHMTRYQTHRLEVRPGTNAKKGEEPIDCTVVSNPLVGNGNQFPLWNMYTTKDVIAHHNDIFLRKNLWNFIAKISVRKIRANELCR